MRLNKTDYEFEFGQRRGVDHYVKERTIVVTLNDVLQSLTADELEEYDNGDLSDGFLSGVAHDIACRWYEEEFSNGLGY